MDASEAGRILSLRRPTQEMRCQECGAVMVGTRRRKWCSPRCAMRAWRRAHTRKPLEGKSQTTESQNAPATGERPGAWPMAV